MGVKERQYMKDPEVTTGPSLAGWLARINEYGERHATAIISVSTALIILTVLIFAKYFFDRSQLEHAQQELASAESITILQELKKKYPSTPVAPQIVFRLANKLQEEGRLEDAKTEYLYFQNQYPLDPLNDQVRRALDRLNENLAFEQDVKARRLKEYRLQTSPRQFAEAKDPRFRWGPLFEARPAATIEVGSVLYKIELFEDEAPNTVANFVKLCEAHYFDGVKLDRIGDDRLETEPKAEKPVEYSLALEATTRPAPEGSLVLIRKEGAKENQAGRFQILLKEVKDLKDVTIFGLVQDHLTELKSIKKGDSIKSIKIQSKREHPYEPATLNQK
jgi:cyclophilin family peptidyl-prolyl cis-trans isomerase